MANRLDLQNDFEKLLGSRNVYFQPPASVKMSYPCVRYSSSGYDLRHANNMVYNNTRKYEGVVIDRDPDSNIPVDMLRSFKMIRFGSAYVADNRHHFPFTLYY